MSCVNMFTAFVLIMFRLFRKILILNVHVFIKTLDASKLLHGWLKFCYIERLYVHRMCSEQQVRYISYGPFSLLYFTASYHHDWMFRILEFILGNHSHHTNR